MHRNHELAPELLRIQEEEDEERKGANSAPLHADFKPSIQQSFQNDEVDEFNLDRHLLLEQEQVGSDNELDQNNFNFEESK